MTSVQQQWADDVYVQTEHKQTEKCNEQNVRQNRNQRAITKINHVINEIKKINRLTALIRIHLEMPIYKQCANSRQMTGVRLACHLAST